MLDCPRQTITITIETSLAMCKVMCIYIEREKWRAGRPRLLPSVHTGCHADSNSITRPVRTYYRKL